MAKASPKDFWQKQINVQKCSYPRHFPGVPYNITRTLAGRICDISQT